MLKSLPFEAPWAAQGGEFIGIDQDAARARDVIEIVALNSLAVARKDRGDGNFDAKKIMEGLIADVSQNPVRGGKMSRTAKLPCLCSSTHIFIYARDFLLPGRYHHRVSGFPDNLDWECLLDPIDLSAKRAKRATPHCRGATTRQLDRAVRQRIGESYSLPQAATAHAGVFLLTGMPWWRSMIQ